jgi:Polyketide cyclase / dehydrase and lipid transport
MLKKILLLLVVVIVGIAGYAAFQPNDFRVERKITIAAPPEKIQALLVDFNRWKDWSPWEKLDPEMKKTISGAPSGVGAIYEWSGNKDVGSGRMEVLETNPELVRMKVNFSAPMSAENTNDFLLKANGTSTDVTWAMYGTNSYKAKVVGLFINMDKMIGGDFDTGLANLKTLAEKP